MRPKKKVLLLAKTVPAASEIKFMLELRSYDVTATTYKREAVAALEKDMYKALVLEYPWEIDVLALNLPYRLPVVVFGNAPIDYMADHRVASGEIFAWRLTEAVALATARKPGPYKGARPVDQAIQAAETNAGKEVSL